VSAARRCYLPFQQPGNEPLPKPAQTHLVKPDNFRGQVKRPLNWRSARGNKHHAPF